MSQNKINNWKTTLRFKDWRTESGLYPVSLRGLWCFLVIHLDEEEKVGQAQMSNAHDRIIFVTQREAQTDEPRKMIFTSRNYC